MKTLRAEFPTQKIGLGELGYWIAGQQFWWAYNQTDTLAAKRMVAEQYYNAAFDYPGSIGGVFWWTYIQDFKSDTAMQQIVKTLRDKLQSGAPTPTPTPMAPAIISAPVPSGGAQSSPAKKVKKSKKAAASKSDSRSSAKKSTSGSAKKSGSKKVKKK
jgi:hypothetical protein